MPLQYRYNTVAPQTDFPASANVFSTARLPFSSFAAYRGGRRMPPAEAPELDPGTKAMAPASS